MRNSSGLSVLSGEPADEAHHVVAKSWLREHGLAEHVWDHRNGVALTRREHDRHTSRLEALPLSCLPDRVYDFVQEHQLEHYLERYYTGGSK